MADTLKQFTSAAKNLSRNPLGIIALFIVLIYGFACLVTGLAGDFKEAERLPLVWFLTLFPVAVLGVFGWLVAYHHLKLYSPGDFPDKETFYKLALAAFNPNLEYLEFTAAQDKVKNSEEYNLEEKVNIGDDEEEEEEGPGEFTGSEIGEGSESEAFSDTVSNTRSSRLKLDSNQWDFTTAAGRKMQREALYRNNRYIFLSYVIVPSQKRGQKADIFIYLVRHQDSQDFSDVATTEFYFGPSWRNRIFTGTRIGNLIGVKTSAYGSFLCTCRITFNDSRFLPITLYQYIDISTATVIERVFPA